MNEGMSMVYENNLSNGVIWIVAARQHVPYGINSIRATHHAQRNAVSIFQKT